MQSQSSSVTEMKMLRLILKIISIYALLLFKSSHSNSKDSTQLRERDYQNDYEKFIRAS